MATKKISISEDVYKRLVSLKGENESFSSVIERIVAYNALSRFQGILSKQNGYRVEKSIRQARRKDREARERKTKNQARYLNRK